MNKKIFDKISSSNFGIYIDFDKDAENPERIFNALSELVQACSLIDKTLIQTISAKIEPVILLEDIKTGSIGALFKYILKNIDDEALKDLDVKKIIGSFLVAGKTKLIQFIEQNDKIISAEQIEILEAEFEKLAEESEIKKLPIYNKIPRQELLIAVDKTKTAITHLRENDKAVFVVDEKEIEFNKNFEFSSEEIQDLLAKELIENKATMILLVKKPDYLGDSKWEFKHNKRRIDAKILHDEWLNDFQSRKIDVRPGDALKVIAIIKEKYDHNNEVLSVQHDVLEVIEVIQDPNFKQLPLIE